MKEKCAIIHEKNIKAFNIIEHLIACYNNDEDKCSTMEACNSCEHSATLEEITEALKVAISAVEKQEAKQAKMSWDINFGKVRPHCPVCGESNPMVAKYCFNCGQRIKEEKDNG